MAHQMQHKYTKVNKMPHQRPCKNGSECWTVECSFYHETTKEFGGVSPAKIRKMMNTAKKNASNASNVKCRYGSRCNRADCTFEHNTDTVTSVSSMQVPSNLTRKNVRIAWCRDGDPDDEANDEANDED